MRYPKHAARLAVGAMLAGLPAVSPARADVDIRPTYVGMTPQNVGVMDRARPAYDAKGIRLGSFRLYPTLDLEGSYDDNVFRQPDGRSDYFFTIAPAFRLESQWGRHAVEIYSAVTDYEYLKYNSESLTDWIFGANTRWDVSHIAALTVNGSYGELHESWFAPNIVPDQLAPNRYYLGRTDVELRVQPARLGFAVGAGIRRYDWQNTPIAGGLLYNKDRNMTQYVSFGEIFYDFSPGYAAFVKASYDERDFDERIDRGSVYRSSHGYRFDGGLRMQVTHLVSGEIYGGYLHQSFRQSVITALPDVSGFDYGVNLNWYATPLVTVHISGKRELDDVIISGASVADNRSISLGVDYELRPNIIVRMLGYYTNSHYPGVTRSESYPGASIGFVFLLNRYLSANLNYNYSDRSTEIAALRYTDNMVSAGLTLHL